jgi:hypothetical protein
MSLIQISNSQLNGFIAIATCAYGKEVGKLAAYMKYGDKAEDCQFEKFAMIGPMIDAINYIVPEVRAHIYLSVPNNPALVIISVSVAGYGVIGTSTWQGNVNDTATNLVNQINLGGVFHAYSVNEFVIVQAPIGAGATFNGIIATVSTTIGFITVGATQPFINGFTATTWCNTYDEVFSMMEFISKRLGFCYDLNQTPTLN